MTVQVCLGEIETWVVIDPQRMTSFIEATFAMEMPDSGKCETVDLKECYVSGKFVTSFDIVHESEQRNLTKFLEFTAIASFGNQLQVIEAYLRLHLK